MWLEKTLFEKAPLGNRNGKKKLRNTEINIENTEFVRFPGGGNGNPPQYACLGNPMDRGTWRAAIYKLYDLATKQ